MQADEIAGKGTFFWLGAADTQLWVDPSNDVIVVGMTQWMLAPTDYLWLDFLYRPLVYQALLKPKM